MQTMAERYRPTRREPEIDYADDANGRSPRIYEIIEGRLYQSGAWRPSSDQHARTIAEQYGISGILNVWRHDDRLENAVRFYKFLPLSDSREIPDPEDLGPVVEAAVAHINAGGAVCTMCQAGINRSGLLSALIAMRLLDCSGRRAVELVRQGRDGALQNAAFVEHLEGLAAPDSDDDDDEPSVRRKATLATFEDLDGRTKAARQARSLIAEIQRDLGGDLTAGQQQLVQRVGMLSAMLEDLEVKWLERRGHVDLGLYGMLADRQRRLLETLGLRRVAKNVIPGNGATAKALQVIEQLRSGLRPTNGVRGHG